MQLNQPVSGYLCLLKKGDQNAIMTFSLDGNFLDISVIADPSVYEHANLIPLII